MNKSYVIAVAFSALVTNAQAALYDRGNGMIYDSAQNITWLQDADYAETSGALSDGTMGWDIATTWATNLNYMGITGWRLPSAKLIGQDTFSDDGSTDVGYNNTRSEIGHLFFELGNVGCCDPNYGLQNSEFVDAGSGLNVSFINVTNYVYWETEAYATDSSKAWVFRAYSGIQAHDPKIGGYYAWAVHDGDVAAVPVPAAAWLFGSGLLGLVGAARRKRLWG
jgi:hypothetical protein